MEPQRARRLVSPDACKIAMAVFGVLVVMAFALWATGHAAFFHYADSKGFLRFARDPIPGPGAHFSGTRADTTYHFARVLLPGLAWFLALGHSGSVGWTLVLVNTAACGVLVGAAAELLERNGRRADLAFWLAVFPGVWMLYAFVYSELLALALLMVVYVLWADERPRAARIAAAFVPLARETAILGLLPLVWRDVRRRGARAAVSWLPSLAPMFVWWTLVWARMGAMPPFAHSDFRHGVLGAPGTGLLSSWHRNGVGFLFVVIAIECAVAILGALFVAARRNWFPFAPSALLFGGLVACLGWRGTWYVFETLRHACAAYVMVIMCVLLGRRTSKQSDSAPIDVAVAPGPSNEVANLADA